LNPGLTLTQDSTNFDSSAGQTIIGRPAKNQLSLKDQNIMASKKNNKKTDTTVETQTTETVVPETSEGQETSPPAVDEAAATASEAAESSDSAETATASEPATDGEAAGSAPDSGVQPTGEAAAKERKGRGPEVPLKAECLDKDKYSEAFVAKVQSTVAAYFEANKRGMKDGDLAAKIHGGETRLQDFIAELTTLGFLGRVKGPNGGSIPAGTVVPKGAAAVGAGPVRHLSPGSEDEVKITVDFLEARFALTGAGRPTLGGVREVLMTSMGKLYNNQRVDEIIAFLPQYTVNRKATGPAVIARSRRRLTWIELLR